MTPSTSKRIGLLFQKHLVEHRNFYMIGTAVVVALLLFGLYILRDAPSVWNAAAYYMGASMVGIFALFAMLIPTRKVHDLLSNTLPASPWEKFAFHWLLCYVATPLVFIVLTSIIMGLHNLSSPEATLHSGDFVRYFAKKMFPMLFLHALIFAGNMHTYTKMKSWHWIVVIAGVILLTRTWHFGDATFVMLHPVGDSELLLNSQSTAMLRISHLGMVPSTLKVCDVVFTTASILIFWVAGWFAFRENETR